MIRNPFNRKPKTPLDQALAVLDDVRSEAADAAEQIRDAAAKVADALADADVPKERRLPIAGVAAAVALGVGLAIRARAKRGSEPSIPASATGAKPPAPSVAAAAAGSPPSGPVSGGDEPGPEEPAEPKAATAESDAAST